MMLQITMTQKAIASAIGVDKSTICWEIQRNSDGLSGNYVMDLARRKADKRKSQNRHKEVLTPQMKKRIKKLFEKGLSPKQIAVKSSLDGISMVSYETIYWWIWKDKWSGGKLHIYLRRQVRKYAKRRTRIYS